MKKRLNLIAAPTSTQPGGYINKAYLERTVPFTKWAIVEVNKEASRWVVELTWACANPVKDASDQTDAFVDAAAVLVPSKPNAQWITMGDTEKPVEGALWRPDQKRLIQIHAQGLGSVQRQASPEGWEVISIWNNDLWNVKFSFSNWLALESHRQLAIAIWQGAAQDRGGLKSISPGWLPLEPAS